MSDSSLHFNDILDPDYYLMIMRSFSKRVFLVII